MYWTRSWPTCRVVVGKKGSNAGQIARLLQRGDRVVFAKGKRQHSQVKEIGEVGIVSRRNCLHT